MMRDREGRELILGQYWDYEREEWTNRDGSRLPELHAVSAVPVDWDADGDFDLVLGTASGRLVRWMNLGTRTESAFDLDAEEIQIPQPPPAPPVTLTTEEEIQAAMAKRPRTRGHAMPEIADWDQDGAWDLVVGTDGGAVHWARNVGRPGEPAFAPLEELVEAPQALDGERSGADAHVDVADLNGDGRVDLIVGDNWQDDGEHSLSAGQLARFRELQEQLSASMDVLEVLSGEDEAARRALDSKRVEAVEALMQEYSALQPEMTFHGYVWLYARAAAGSR